MSSGSRDCDLHLVFFDYVFKLLILKKMVEVAGIEPASEGLQRTEPTCVSDSLGFADASFERARTQRHASPLVFRPRSKGKNPSLACCVASRPDLAGKIGET
jgi:hypothetical protein